MLNYSNYILAIFLAFLSQTTLAQNTVSAFDKVVNDANVKLTGQLIDNGTGSPLEYATISVFSLPDSSLVDGTLSDVDGRFEIEIKNFEKAYIVIEFIGYTTRIFNSDAFSTVQNGIIDMGTIALINDALALDEIEIRAEKSETQFALDKRIFNVGKDLANRGGSAVDVLDNVPAVTVDIEGQVSLRGSTGVRILINGRRSGLGENLQSIPSNQIDRIEVITNPSSRYDAEGVAGIINIILKQDRRQGFNGSFDLSGGYPFQLGGGANINYRKNDVNWFAGYGYQHRESPGGGFQFTRIDSDGQSFYSDQNNDRNRVGDNHTMRFGIDYFFDDNTTLTGTIRYQIQNLDNFTENIYRDYIDNYPGNLIGVTNRTDDEEEDETELEYSLTFRKNYSSRDHYLNVSVDYEDELESEFSAFDEEINLVGEPKNNLLQRSSNDEGQKEFVFQADYVHPFSDDHQFEVGVKGSFREITNDFLVEEFKDDKWGNLLGLSNNFIYDENIYAAYVQYGNKLGQFSYQLGMRSEYGDITTELLQTNEVNARDKLDFFPSVFLNYNFSEKQAMQVSYTRRISRPHFWHLNPFFTYNDSRNLFVGNPNLNPEYTDSYELNFLRFWEEATVNVGAFYRFTTGVIERIRTIDTEGVTTLRPQNLSEQEDFGLEVSVNYSATKWLRLDGSANFFRSITDGKNLGESFTADTYTWNSRLSARITFLDDTDFQLRGNYRAPRQTTQGEDLSMTSIDIGISRDFLPKKNLTITLGVRDLLNSRKRRYTQFGPDFYTTGEFQWRARATTLSLNYRINQKKQRERGGGDFGDGEM